MATGTQREDRIRVGLPIGESVTGLLLALALAGILYALAGISSPVYAHAAGRPVVAAGTVDRGLTGRADRVTQWQRVLTHCRTARDCQPVPARIRRAAGIRPGRKALIEYGDTTYIWVKLPCGKVRTITS